MSRKLLIVLAFVGVTTGCGKIESGSTLKNNDWRNVMTCDNNRVRIDVDTSNNRHLQIVIQNRSANDFLDNIAAHAGLDSISGGSYQRVYSGLQANGYMMGSPISAGTAQNIHGYNGSAVPLERNGNRYATSFNEHLVFKTEAGGIKIEFTRTDINQCRYYNGRFGKCDNQGTFFVANEYRGNWFFPGCKQ